METNVQSTEPTYWSLHTHTRESAADALPSISRTVARAKELGYPALAITDHGTISGAVEFYLECRRNDIEPLIGVEAYLTLDRSADRRGRMHACIVAYSEVGYRNLCWLTTQSNVNFRYRPTIDLADLADAYERGRLDGLLMTSGCWFGLVPKLMRQGDFSSVPNVARALSTWFDGRFFIEVQNHMVHDDEHDDELYGWLMYNFAIDNDLPMVVTQDSHYLFLEDKDTHDTFKRLASFKENSDDATFPGDGYHMADQAWIEAHHNPVILEAGLAGLESIRQMAHLRISELDTFELKVPDTTVSGDPDTELMESVDAAVTRFIAAGKIPARRAGAYRERAEEEMEVIMNSGFSGYIMLVRSTTDFINSKGIQYRVRGSATGSLVCWVLGITGYDPIKWGLSFDRFLSRDRAKPPDVDIDVEHERRQEVLDWLENNFYSCHISTSMKYGITDDEGAKKGTLIGALRMLQRKMGADDSSPITDEWWRELEKIAYYNGRNSDGTEIDPPLASIGQHAAGILIAKSAQDLAVVPRRWIPSSSTMVSAYDQNDVEALGLVKLDILGLRTLSALAFAAEATGIDPESISLTDQATYRRLGSGNTTGVFQFEGWASRKGAKRMKPTKINDVIAAMALFRPATMTSGATDQFLARRSFAAEIPQRHDIIMRHTKDTFGVLLYQEQALNIMKDLGLSVEEVEKARKAIKASNANVGGAAATLVKLMDHIRSLAHEAGMSVEDSKWLEHALSAYAGYSFNRAHATAYGILAYQTAWFLVHHKVEFWTGLLNSSIGQGKNAKTGVKPEQLYLSAAGDDGVVVVGPHVNSSQVKYSTDGEYIRTGLSSVLMVGEEAAAEIVAHAPFDTLDDMAERLAPGSVSGVKDLLKGHSPAACGGVIAALDKVGALSGIGWRSATGPMDKVARNHLITVANKMILDLTGARVSRKDLGLIADEMDTEPTFWELARPDRAKAVANAYLKEHHGNIHAR